MALSTSIANNIDDEWSSFLSNKTAIYDDSDDDRDSDGNDADTFHEPDFNGNTGNAKQSNIGTTAPEPTPIYISTQSKIAYLTEPIDLKIFWDIPVIPYSMPSNGVIKKQIKINSKTPEELEEINKKLESEVHHDVTVISHINNPNGRIKFKDIRKISIGVSKKDIMSYRGKKKQAFYNCFVMIIRIRMDDGFKEFHIKVFNTGKLEIPGIQSETMFDIVLKHIVQILQPYCAKKVAYKQTSDTVLINSNFNCGFYIDRESLYDLLKYKYNLQAIYDPCSYPGIQCKFYCDKSRTIQTGQQPLNAKADGVTEVSFMIFRTGSVLIVGKCDESLLNDIYDFLTKLLKTEFKSICQQLIDPNDISAKDKKAKKVRRKVMNFTKEDDLPGIEFDEVACEVTEEIVTGSSCDLNGSSCDLNGSSCDLNDSSCDLEEIIVKPKKSRAKKSKSSQ
jgi:TATA-box binding protein (TBP) (component of TFIID and TFIIIB)